MFYVRYEHRFCADHANRLSAVVCNSIRNAFILGRKVLRGVKSVARGSSIFRVLTVLVLQISNALSKRQYGSGEIVKSTIDHITLAFHVPGQSSGCLMGPLWTHRVAVQLGGVSICAHATYLL